MVSYLAVSLTFHSLVLQRNKSVSLMVVNSPAMAEDLPLTALSSSQLSEQQQEDNKATSVLSRNH